MSVSGWLVRRELEPRVLHRLPGRIRFEIPALTRIDPAIRSGIEDRLHRAALPEGIDRIRVDLATGSLLIEYDRERMDEPGVIVWLRTLVDSTREMIESFALLADRDRAASLAVLTDQIDRSLDRGTVLGGDLAEAIRVCPA